MSASTGFKDAISAHLQSVADKDPLFAETLKKPNKNIDECCTYITNEVRKNHKGSAVAVSDAEVFGMAIHYYDEDDIKVSSTGSAKATVSHKPEPKKDETPAAPAPVASKPVKKAKGQIDPSIQPSFF